MIGVTKAFLPPQEEYQSILGRAWNMGWLTNRGLLVRELEDSLKKYLDVPYLLATTNGTLPLQMAVKVLDIKGEIITTPFSYVATTSSIVWEGCTPVFVDIHPEYLTIDESKIEEAITDKTTAILATHVFGNPCHVEAIDKIAKKYNLKVIYDGAHAFGVSYKGQSLFNYGDVSTCSFHATKLFHTGEGGALFCRSELIYEKLFYHHNFGHQGQEAFQGLGINAKMSELQAAMGLAVLPYVENILEERKEEISHYRAYLLDVPIKFLKIRLETQWNYAYFPVIFSNEKDLINVQRAMNKKNIYPRRYFYPTLNTLPYVTKTSMPLAESISSCILCLPLYTGLTKRDIFKITEIIKNTIC